MFEKTKLSVFAVDNFIKFPVEDLEQTVGNSLTFAVILGPFGQFNDCAGGIEKLRGFLGSSKRLGERFVKS